MPHPYPWSITIVLPALNEERVVGSVLEKIFAELDGKVRDFELLLIDDGSADSTATIMEAFAGTRRRVRVLRNEKNIGLGASYVRGVREARCEYVMLLCGDGGFPASSLAPVFERIGQADIVIPCMANLREIKTPLRYLLSRLYTGLLNLLFSQRLQYYNGLPVHRLELLRSVEITSSGFGFQGEILVKLLKSGCTYVEVAVLGAEQTKRSSALRVRNLVSVAGTLAHLLWEILRFKPIPKAVIEQARGEEAPGDSEPTSVRG